MIVSRSLCRCDTRLTSKVDGQFIVKARTPDVQKPVANCDTWTDAEIQDPSYGVAPSRSVRGFFASRSAPFFQNGKLLVL